MNRTELVAAVAERAGLSKEDANRALTALNDSLMEAAQKGDKVQIPGLLTLEVVERAARSGRNPRTGETMEIAAKKAVRLTPGAALKRAANGED
ncbi:bacterial nucleoid protein Hbs [Raineyella antarctica]|jgi:DNA-binding protein HU-beta|uniref:Bacterial nucleoid protein Hbs n=1 Tax=Raineyella antarctica TaxID=1577474 RepID=A0A1G6H811_9ACTN|nr:HU family DNA-binding protein [Raineyella antarctica]SDB90228.1 bacterial nucleoid protein Hbs [Raineyella antarctica]